MYKAFLVLCVVFLAGCASPTQLARSYGYADNTQFITDHFELIKIGMSKDKVTQMFGPPYRVVSNEIVKAGEREKWQYERRVAEDGNWMSVFVEFLNNGVESVTRKIVPSPRFRDLSEHGDRRYPHRW